MKCIIIDDEPLARSVVAEYLQTYEDIKLMQECGDGFEGVKAIVQHEPDLVFLDIQMPKVNGFEMLELLEQTPAVIFTTAFDEYAMKAFEAHAVDYLLKPFSKERFDQAIEKWRAVHAHQVSQQNVKDLVEDVTSNVSETDRVVVKNGQNIRIIPVQDIDFIEAYDDYVKIHVQDIYFLKKKTMSFFEKTLDPKQFVRIHRSFIVQVSQITRIEQNDREHYEAILKSGKTVALSRNGYTRLKEVLGW